MSSSTTLLVNLDADPSVMRFTTGGPGPPRTEVVTEILPACPAYDRWGQGLGTRASAVLSERGFRPLGVRRVTARTMGFHVASRRVMEKEAMRLVRHVVADGPEGIPGVEHGDVG